MPRVLPTEVLDHVFGLVNENTPQKTRTVLAMASLVCAAWSRSAQRWLYRDVIIQANSRHGLPEFLVFINDNPHVAPFVVDLFCRGPLRLPLHEEKPRISVVTLRRVIEQLPRLRHLTLANITGWAVTSDAPAGVPFTPFPITNTMISLSLHSVTFEGPTHAPLSFVRGVKTLELMGVRVFDEEGQNAPLFVQTTRLALKVPTCPERMITAFRIGRQTTHLELSDFLERDLGGLDALLNAVGFQLEEFGVHFKVWARMSPGPPSVLQALRTCKNLRKITISLPVDDKEASAMCRSILSSAPDTIQYIDVVLDYSGWAGHCTYPGRVAAPHWGDIWDVLHSLSALRELALSVKPPRGQQDFPFGGLRWLQAEASKHTNANVDVYLYRK